MIETILSGLIRANLAAGAAILLVAAIRKLVRPRFGARAAYALWLAPLAAGLAALPPHTVTPWLIAPVMRSAVISAGEFVAAASPAASGPDLASLALAVWLAGLAAAVVLVGWRQGRFLRAMGRLEPAAEPGVFRAEHVGVGPAVVGTLRARIVTPADFEIRFAADERALILAHERAHLAGGDAGANALACAAQCLCWFNPLVHLAARLARIDQELACDAAVVGRFPDARRAYGELLLKTQLFTQALPLGCHWPAPAEHPLKERIAMLKSPPPARAMRVMGLGVVASLTLGAASMAWAALAAPPAPAPRPAPVLAQPDWITKPNAADVADVYPPAAMKAGLSGAATLGCKVSAEGRLSDCKVEREAPAEAGFGAAALKLSERFQMKPLSRDGQPVSGGVVRIPFRFTTPPQPVAPS